MPLVAPELITHDAARKALRTVIDAVFSPRQRADAQLLANYIEQCSATSGDMKACVKAVLAAFGPEGLKIVQKAVEDARVPPAPRVKTGYRS
jgi:hypothetical protein